MNNCQIVNILGFSPKENTENIFIKTYENGYSINVDFAKNQINYGEKIQIGRDNCLLLGERHEENVVTLECVDKLLTIGYNPENIFLEKAYPAGRGVTKYLDILVYQDEKPYLMIECKTYGEEFDKELKNTQKNGGQLFTYFQLDTKTELLMLYASETQCKIIKVEEDFRNAGSVKNAHNLWDKKFYEKGFWENPPYDFRNEIFTKLDLRELTEDEGKKLFHGFATILRKHSVSDKPNAFNVIFNLFLAKLYDEQKRDEDELEFQWKKDDNPVDFQVRLYNLHKEGLNDFLKKEIEGIYDKDFEAKTAEDLYKAKKKFLKFNKLFDIKSVFDDNDFEQNHRVLREVVEMLQKYQIRYPRKQKYLSEFFELLLTTGLKQEAGQYFTPPPVAKFIVKSLPLPQLIEQEINNALPKLPAVVDYAAGSGHFITEIMEEYQDIIKDIDAKKVKYSSAENEIISWQVNPYSWAAKYVYGIEKDYRLVKVAKVGCYFYGDGLAQIIHGDGLDSFEKSKSYIGLLQENAKKPQFSVVISNPPYSVDDIKDDLEYIGAQNEFTLFKNLSAKSNAIECLFVERIKQLLKEGGVAGIVLPISILSKGGKTDIIYIKTREIILQYFDIVGITQLGGNTFMATNTNTVVFFLRKRNENEVQRIKNDTYRIAENYLKTHEDLTIKGIKEPIEKPVKKYFDFTKETKINPEKFYYFVLNYHQKTVIVKTGNKEEEKRFLGYKIIKRRGNEGFQAIHSKKTIEECTRLFDDKDLENLQKASTYIYKAFTDDYKTPVHETLKENISRIRLLEMLTFNRENFDKNISLSSSKDVECESKWNLVTLGDYLFENGKSDIQVGNAKDLNNGNYPFFTSGENVFYFDKYLVDNQNVYLSTGGNAVVKFYDGKAAYSTDTFVVKSNNEGEIKTKFIFYLLESVISDINDCYFKGVGLKHLQKPDFRNMQIPLPPLEIQQKIISEIEVLEKKENEVNSKIENLKEKIEQGFRELDNKADKTLRVSDTDIFDISIGKRVLSDEVTTKGIPVFSANVFEPFGFIDKYLITDFSVSSVLWGIDGDWMVNYMPASKPFYPTDHCGVLRVKNNEILPKYLVWLLNEEGKKICFSRALRASIDRIQGITIKVPPLSEQQKIVSEIEKIETQIAELETELKEIPKQKEKILKDNL
jgi:type I restriction enzyme M protein